MLIIEKVLLLKNSDIFKNCKEVDLIEIASICFEENMDPKTLVFNKGDVGNCMYFIYSGQISIHDNEHQLAVLSENEIFGELSLLDSDTRSASATALTDCVLLRIEQDHFYDVVATNADILKGIMRTLCKRLREQDRANIEMKKSKGTDFLKEFAVI